MTQRLLLILLPLLIFQLLQGQESPTEKYLSDELSTFTKSNSPHRLTIFVIPPKVKYDWTSPRSLQKSYFKNYRRDFFKKEKYLLGHAFIELSTPLAENVIFTGMRSSSQKQKKQLLFKEGYGLAILGTDLQGHLENYDHLMKVLDKYSHKGKLAFFTMLISEDAAERMLEFFERFQSIEDSVTAPRFHYGGAYYPRYHGEGAGCAAFAISFLDLGGLLREIYNDWMIEVNIPIDLMGGPYNVGNEVGLRDICKKDHWADADKENRDSYEPYEIYEPTLMYEWVHEIWKDDALLPQFHTVPVNIDKARGILIDMREVSAPIKEPIFIKREKPSIFVRQFIDSTEK